MFISLLNSQVKIKDGEGIKGKNCPKWIVVNHPEF
jgi:hypothetical protein